MSRGKQQFALAIRRLGTELAKDSSEFRLCQRRSAGHNTAKDGFFPDKTPVEVNKWGTAPLGYKLNPYAPSGYEHLLRIPHAVAEDPTNFRVFWWNGVPVYQNIRFQRWSTVLGALATFWGVTGYYEHWHDVAHGARYMTIDDVSEADLHAPPPTGKDLVHYPTWGPFSRRSLYGKEGKEYDASQDKHGHH